MFYRLLTMNKVVYRPKANIGCRTGGSCIASVFLYVDDIILLAPSAQVLQYLVNICEMELKFLDMTISASIDLEPACDLAKLVAMHLTGVVY